MIVSIIVPVYNTGIVLEKCIKSIFRQTYAQYEVIFVDDASSDDLTKRLLNEALAKDSRVKVIKKNENEGVELARYSGINAAKGDYVCFVDADDWLERGALEVWVKVAIDADADLVVASSRTVLKKYGVTLYSKSNYFSPSFTNRVITTEEIMNKQYISFFGYNSVPANIWGKLYRRDLLLELTSCPCNVAFGEDLYANIVVYPKIQRMVMLNTVLYNYRVGVKKWSEKYLHTWMENARSLYRIKLEYIQKYDVKQGRKFADIELANFLRTYILKLNEEKITEEICIQKVLNELSTPEFRNLQYESMKGPISDILLTAIEAKDARLVYSQVLKESQLGTLRTKVFRLLRYILESI